MTVVGVGTALDVVGVGEIVDEDKDEKRLPRFNLPVITARNTTTTTRPSMKEIILLKLSI